MQWEYLEATRTYVRGEPVLHTVNGGAPSRSMLWFDFVRQAGKEGWELVAVTHSNTENTFYFKRSSGSQGKQ